VSAVEGLLRPGTDRASEALPSAAEISSAVVGVQTATRAASGFVVDRTLIFTTAHTVDGVNSVSVRFASGARRTGTVLAVDLSLDLAVIEVRAMPVNVRPLDWQSMPSPEPTSPVWAWGYPLEGELVSAGFTSAPSVSAGIVSARRSKDGIAFLQLDAALNPGSSGGPIVTQDGMVVGISTAIFAPAGRDAEGLNFAIDIASHRDAIRRLLDQLNPEH
jgi:S1-C subfamily serine protease